VEGARAWGQTGGGSGGGAGGCARAPRAALRCVQAPLEPDSLTAHARLGVLALGAAEVSLRPSLPSTCWRCAEPASWQWPSCHSCVAGTPAAASTSVEADPPLSPPPASRAAFSCWYQLAASAAYYAATVAHHMALRRVTSVQRAVFCTWKGAAQVRINVLCPQQLGARSMPDCGSFMAGCGRARGML